MKTVSDLFSELSFGELSNLSMSLNASGEIDEIRQGQVIAFANDALTALYTRFPHNTDYVKVTLQDGQNKYYLRTEFAVSDQTPGNLNTRYITDTVDEPFAGRLSKIISIWDKDAEYYLDEEVVVNDEYASPAVKLLSYDGFYVDEPVADNVYTVKYQALHPLLSIDPAVETENIVLAPVLWQAFKAYVASSIFASIGGEDATVKAATQMNIYEGICIRAEADDTLQKSSSENHDKLREGGWE